MEAACIASDTHLSPCRKTVFAILSISVIILSIYSNTLDASWHFDDFNGILNRKALHIEAFTWQEIRKTFFGPQGSLYRPVPCFTLAVNYYFGKSDVSGYHLVNISTHLLACIFLFLFLYHSLHLPLLRARYGPCAYFLALLSAVLWGMNAMHTQAVTYIIQRMAIMAGMFHIITMYFYLKGRTSKYTPLKVVHFGLCFVSGIMALGSKQNAAMLPINIMLYEVFLVQGLINEKIKRNLIIFLILIFIPLTLAVIFQGPMVLEIKRFFMVYAGSRDFTLWERLLTQSRILLLYLSLLIYPMPNRLNIDHDVMVSRGLIHPPTTIIALSVIIALLCVFLVKSRKWPLVSFCILFFFLNHVVESSIFPLELVSEHRNYLPSMFLFVPFAILILKGIKFFSHKRVMQTIFVSFVILLLIGYGHGTFVRNVIWRTEESLWLDAVDKSPNLPRPHLNLGKFYADRGLKGRALEQYELAVKLPRGPNDDVHYIIHFNMGLIYESMGEYDEAKAHSLMAIEIEPRFPKTYSLLGSIAMKRGQYDEAFNYLMKALNLDRTNAEAHNTLGILLLKKGQIEFAMTEFQETLKNDEDNVTALIHVGVAYRYLGEYGKAVKYLKRAIRINEKNIMTYLHLIETYFLAGQKSLSKKTAAELVECIPCETLSKFMESMSSHNNSVGEPPNMEVVSNVLSEAIDEKAERYEALKSRLLQMTFKRFH